MILLFGKLIISFIIFRLVKLIYEFVRAYILPLYIGAVNLKEYGKYAVITGSNKGIGRSYAIEMASHGMDLILVARAKDELEALKKDIVEKYKVEVLIFLKDFSNDNGYEELKTFLSDKDIGLLINNAGIVYDYAEYLHLIPDKNQDMIMTVNLTSHLKMINYILPGMIKRNRGAIIEISSLIGMRPFPLFSIYGTSKIGTSYYLDCLKYENKDSNIFFQNIRPGLVATSMSKQKASINCPSPESFAWWATRTIGRLNDTSGHPIHEINRLIIKILPDYLFYPVILKYTLKLRTKVLNKLKKST